jgi:hypothetical protein
MALREWVYDSEGLWIESIGMMVCEFPNRRQMDHGERAFSMSKRLQNWICLHFYLSW